MPSFLRAMRCAFSLYSLGDLRLMTVVKPCFLSAVKSFRVGCGVM